jgi:ABC-type uncharacterized transport system permease subunit
MGEVLRAVTPFCFAASYAVALLLELVHQRRQRPALRLLVLVAGGAGLVAHTVYVGLQSLSLATGFGSLMLLAWILALFWFYGSIHHRRVAWGLFVLPLVLGLVLLASLFPSEPGPRSGGFWPVFHGVLVLLASVGVSVGFVASVMYLVQVRRLRAKTPPGQGVRLLSLERLEAMNRRALILAFPLLTVGLLVGLGLTFQAGEAQVTFESVKIISTVGLWFVFLILLYLRHAAHARGARLALWTIAAFALLVCSLVSVHPFLTEGPQ